MTNFGKLEQQHTTSKHGKSRDMLILRSALKVLTGIRGTTSTDTENGCMPIITTARAGGK